MLLQSDIGTSVQLMLSSITCGNLWTYLDPQVLYQLLLWSICTSQLTLIHFITNNTFFKLFFSLYMLSPPIFFLLLKKITMTRSSHFLSPNVQGSVQLLAEHEKCTNINGIKINCFVFLSENI